MDRLIISENLKSMHFSLLHHPIPNCCYEPKSNFYLNKTKILTYTTYLTLKLGLVSYSQCIWHHICIRSHNIHTATNKSDALI